MFKKIKSKKGFTLVELLAVIAMIGILSTIAIVSVNNYTKSSHKKYYDKQLELFKVTGQTYFTDHKSKLPTINFAVERVTLNTLISENYINKIVDYKKNECDKDESFVQAQRMGTGKYVYNAYLSCLDKNVGTLNENKSKGEFTLALNHSEDGSYSDPKINGCPYISYYSNDKVNFELIISSFNDISLNGYKYKVYSYTSNSNYRLYKESENIYSNNATMTIKDELSINKNVYKDGTYIIGIIPIDANGNELREEIVKYRHIIIDTEKPTCTIALPAKTANVFQNGWYNKNVKSFGAKIEYKDANIYQYGISNTSSPIYNMQSTFKLEENKSLKKIYGFVKDKAGNIVSCESDSYKADFTSPNISVYTINRVQEYNDVSPNIFTQISDENDKTKFDITSPNGSKYSSDYRSNKDYAENNGTLKTISFSLLPYGRIDNFYNNNTASPGYSGTTYTITLMATDIAGNTASQDFSYKVYENCSQKVTTAITCGAPPYGFNYCDTNARYNGNVSSSDKYLGGYCETDLSVINNNACSNPANIQAVFTREESGACSNSCITSATKPVYPIYQNHAFVGSEDKGICSQEYRNPPVRYDNCYQAPTKKLLDEYYDCYWQEGTCKNNKKEDKEYCYKQYELISNGNFCGISVSSSPTASGDTETTEPCGTTTKTKKMYLCRVGTTYVHWTGTTTEISCNKAFTYKQGDDFLKTVEVFKKLKNDFYVLKTPETVTTSGCTEHKYQYIWKGCLTDDKPKKDCGTAECRG